MVRLGLRALLTVALAGTGLPSARGRPDPGPPAAVRVSAGPGLGSPSNGVRDHAQTSPTITIIANRDVPDSVASTSEVRRIFLLRQRFWPGGRPIAPVNLPARSPLREIFSRRVLGTSPQNLADYWNDLYFHGTQPPPVLESEAAVLLYVARTPGAIGYVSRRTLQATDTTSVKVLLTLTS